MKRLLAALLLGWLPTLQAGSITGQLFNEQTERPLGGGTITLLAADGEGRYTVVRNTRSVRQGYFTFANLEPGQYAIKVTVMYPFSNWEIYDNTQEPSTLTPISIGSDEDIDLGIVGIAPPLLQIVDASMYPSDYVTAQGGKLEIRGTIINSTGKKQSLVVWAVAEEDAYFCLALCGPSTLGYFQIPGAERRITANPGRTTFRLPLQVPPLPHEGYKSYLFTVYAGNNRWDALTYSRDLLSVSVQ